MRRFSSLFLAAVLGSVCTVASYKFLDDDSDKVKIEYAANVPISKVAYSKNEKGEMVPLDFTTAAEKVMPAVVHIRSSYASPMQGRSNAEDPLRDFFGIPRQQFGPKQAGGSGVIINADGYIVTNNHVVEDADEIEVSLLDNRTYAAEVIGTDPDTDLALIRIKEKGLPYLSFVDSDKAKVGEWVLAVGNPYNLNSTVTAGIISAKGRSVGILNRSNGQGGNTGIESFIQTDAAINPGNSGGALVDLQGGLLGINTAIASPTGSYSGYGFAVPSDIVRKIVEDLLQYGVVQRGWMGVSITSVNNQLVKEYDLAVREGAYVSGFAQSSSAKEAGLKEGDVVVKIDETPIRSNTALIEYVGRHRPGDKLNVTVNRKGKEITLPVVLKTSEGKVGTIKAEDIKGFASLGIELEEVDEKVLKNLDIESGVRVKALGNNGKLVRDTEIREGFIITSINDNKVKSVKEVNEILKKTKSGELVVLAGKYENSRRDYYYAFKM
ncbi:MAG TPA: Do family serine endopeptidase [Chryseosolibacter sp.]